MSWLFSQALVEEYSGESSSGGEPSAQLNVMPTLHKFWRNDKTMEFSNLSRFGLTLQLLTESSGEELLMSYLAAFPVRTLVQPEKAQESQVSAADYGLNSNALLARYDHISCSWKTAQCSLFADLEQSLETWPRSGSMLNGVCYQRPMLELHTSAIASGFWPFGMVPTPCAAAEAPNRGSNKKNGPKSLIEFAQSNIPAEPQMWPTPTVCGNYNRPGVSATSGMGLASAVKLWPTPTATEGMGGGSAKSGMKAINRVKRPSGCHRTLALRDAVKIWPTPTASASKGSSPATLTRKSGKSRINDRLDHSVMASDGGQLNPTWVEWLMGWPLGWTDLKPLETDKFRFALPRRGRFSMNAQGSEAAT
jgi:hypothetical protein